MTIDVIKDACEMYADARDELREKHAKMLREIEAVKNRHAPKMGMYLQVYRDRRIELHCAIEVCPEVFNKPKTQTFHGVRVGFKKGTGKVEFDDADAVIRRIERNLSEQTDLYIKTKQTPNKTALQELPAAVLKRLGITVSDTGDQVFIKDTDTELDKLLKAIIAEDEALA